MKTPSAGGRYSVFRGKKAVVGGLAWLVLIAAAYFLLFEVIDRREPVPDWAWILMFFGSPFALGLAVKRPWGILIVPLGMVVGFTVWQLTTANITIPDPHDNPGYLRFYFVYLLYYWALPIAGSYLAGLLARWGLDMARRQLRRDAAGLKA